MGQVIRFSEYQKSRRIVSVESHSLIPVEFGVGVGDVAGCLALIARHGSGTLVVRPVDGASRDVVYLMRVSDAINLNKHRLETEDLSELQITACIDLIQLLENINTSLLESIWSSYHRQSNSGH